MSVHVNSIDIEMAEKKLKECPKVVRDYVQALKSLNKIQQETIKKAVGKIRELAKEVKHGNKI